MLHQIYLRSFADGNGDGIGDLPGIRSRLGNVLCLVNMTEDGVDLPAGELVLAGAPGVDRRLPTDTTAWLRPRKERAS